MRILKTHVLLRLLNSYVVDSPQPANITYLWNFGSLLAVCLIIQILTGAFLAMHYTPNVDFAFNSVEHIMRDVNNGWIIRYTHANVASFFFIFVYMHVARGLYYSSYKTPRVLVWSIGVIILILMMAVAFLGYQHSPKWFNINKNKENKNKKIKYNKVNKNSFNGVVAFKSYNSSPKKPSVGIVGGGIIGRREYSICNTETNSNIALSLRLNEIIQELDLNPVYIFENLNLEKIRKKILNDTKGLSGIYMIVNKITKDYYIGSASTNRFYPRFSNHVIYFKGSKIVKLAVKKYNLENFAYLVLELYPHVVTKENNKELMDLEDKYLKLLLPNYNILTEAGSNFGYKHTEVDRLKMKEIYSDSRREKIGSLNKGKTLSKETIEKIREKALNRNPMSKETKLKCITHIKPIILYNLNGNIYGKYPSILEAAKAINCNEKTIRRALKTEKKLVKRQWIVKDFIN